MLREGERPPIDVRYNKSNKNQYNQNQVFDGEEEEE